MEQVASAAMNRAAAQREPSFDDDRYPSESGERLVEIGFSTFFGEGERSEDEAGPWCVDYGDAIRCHSTLELWMALAAGKLTPQHKVWRDGRACWQPIATVAELTVEPPEELEPSRRSAPLPLRRQRSHEPAEPGWRASLRVTLPVAFAVALSVGIAAGLVATLEREAERTGQTAGH